MKNFKGKALSERGYQVLNNYKLTPKGIKSIKMLELINESIKIYENRLELLDTQFRYHPVIETRIISKHLYDEVQKFLNVLYILRENNQNEKLK